MGDSYVPGRQTSGGTTTATPTKAVASVEFIHPLGQQQPNSWKITYSDGSSKTTFSASEAERAKSMIGAATGTGGAVVRDTVGGTYQPTGSTVPTVPMAGAEDRERQYQDLVKQAMAGGLDEQGQKLLSQLMAQANGEGPSLAEAQARQAADMAIMAQQSAAASAKGPYRGMATREANQASSALLGSLPGQVAQLRLAEQAQAREAAQGLLGQMTMSRDQRLLGLLGLNQGQADTQYQGGLTLAQIMAQRDIARMQNQAQQKKWYDYLLGVGGTLLPYLGLGDKKKDGE